MRTSEQCYFGKIKDCAQEYWQDIKAGKDHSFTYYKKKHGISGYMTAEIFSTLIHNPEPPTDHDVLRLIELSRQHRVKLMNGEAQAPKEKINTPSTKTPDCKPMNGDPLLSKFSARELILELRKRGYRGELTFVSKITV